MKLNIGCGNDIREGWVNVDHPSVVDLLPNPNGYELVGCNLDSPSVRLPFEDNSVTEILAQQIFEHIRNLLPLLQELHRIAEPGGKLMASVPYGSSDGAWADPTHVRAFFLDSWKYFGQPIYCFSDYGYRGDWKPLEVGIVMDRNECGTQLNREELLKDLMSHRNKIAEMRCVLKAIKPIRVAVPGQRDDKDDCDIRVVFGEPKCT